jgi:hypothetical protein
MRRPPLICVRCSLAEPLYTFTVNRDLPELEAKAGDLLVVWEDGIDIVHRVPLDYRALSAARLRGEIISIDAAGPPPLHLVEG